MNSMKQSMFALTAAASLLFSVLPVTAEEVTWAWDEDTRVPTLRRKVATAIDIYTDGTSEDITHEQGIVDGVLYDILRVDPGEHTRVQIDYSAEPRFLDELADTAALDQGLLYAGGINAGYFSNTDQNYGQPVGAVRRNNQWTWWNGEENVPAYGNGFATAYINNNDLSLKYHGWAWGQWNGDSSWHWSTGYTINADYAVSGSYTYFADGEEKDITNGAAGAIDYRTYGRAVTILAQKENGQFLLITIYGTLAEEEIVSFLRDLNVYDAIRMDGGGSTQMVYETTLVKEVEPELSNTKITEEETDHNETILGFATVNVDKLRVRAGARTRSTALGYATNGERYQVYQIVDDGTYTWYRIGSRRWIAGTKDWVSYETAEEKAAAEDAIEKTSVTVNVDRLNIRSDASVSASIVGEAVNGKTYTSTESKVAYGYTWYRIGENEWIAGSPEWVTVTKQ